MTRYLAGIVDLPFVTPQGRLVCRPGYDPETSLYLNLPRDWQIAIPVRPTPDDLRRALQVIVSPFSAYKFANPESAGGVVSGVLAAVCRLVLEVCPAYLIESFQQGSGKTFFSLALGAIVEGQRVAVTPFSAGSNDDELRKRLMAAAIGGNRFCCIDNIIGHYRSSALAAWLTSGKVSDRILGQSRIVEAHVRSLVTLTSNNFSGDSDILRRTVQVRIDSGVNPTHRSYGFNPMSVALARRREIAVAVCTVLMAYFAAGAPDIIAGDAGGFADWNRLCRQPVLWLSREGYADALPWPVISDPATTMLADPSSFDPEIEATGDLLIALWALSEQNDFTSAQVLEWHTEGLHHPGSVYADLRSAIIESVGKGDLSARSIGRVLGFRRERPVGNLKLLARDAGRVKSWRVVQVE